MAKKVEAVPDPSPSFKDAVDPKVPQSCPGCKRVGDHANWCPTKNRPGPGRPKHATD